MAREQSIGSVDQIPEGEGRVFDLGGQKIAVFRTRAGSVFAVQPNCPHRNGPLANGLLGTDTLVCPLHDRTFDLGTGRAIGHDDCLRTYPVRLELDGSVLIVG
jgi:nitrite reductase (NADH) small subunit